MSITIIQSPYTNQPAYNQMVFDVSSSNAGQPNFNFLADVYVSGTLVSRLVFPKQPNSSRLLFDISPVMKNYITYDLENVYGAILAVNNNSVAPYYVQMGEVYDVSGIPTTYTNLTRNPTSGNKYAFNSIFDFEQFTPNILNTYRVESYGLLRTSQNDITIKSGQDLFISFYDPNQVVENIYITTSGSSPIIVTGLNTGTNFIFNFGVKWTDLTSLHSQIAINGFYDITTYDSLGDPILTKRITVETCTDKFTMYRLHWLNQLGGIESYNFDKVSEQTESIDRSQFKKVTPLNYSADDRLKVNYNTVITDNILINSNWLSDADFQWLQGLAESPIVWFEQEDNNIIPIQITNSNYETKKYLNGRRLHQMSLNIEYSYNRYRQSL